MNVEWSQKGEQTRAEIIETAHRLFLENGYHGTSMRQIARETGIALGGIYNHFSGKEDIFLTIILDYHPFIRTLPALQAAQGESIDDFIRDASSRMIEVLGDRLEFINLMFIELVEFDGKHLPALFELIFPKVIQFTQRFIEQHDELRPIPPVVLVRIFLGFFYSYVLTEQLITRQISTADQENSLDYFVDVFLHGILAKPG